MIFFSWIYYVFRQIHLEIQDWTLNMDGEEGVRVNCEYNWPLLLMKILTTTL